MSADLTAAFLNSDKPAVELDPAVFDCDFNEPVVHETVVAELAARRRGTHSTKTRGEVAMTGAKAWRQKGTGRARVGPLSTPHRRGGGVAFGPKPRSYVKKVNRKVRRAALRSVLSLHARRGSLRLVDPDAFNQPRTRDGLDALSRFPGEGRVLVVAEAEAAACTKSFRNIAECETAEPGRVGVYDLLRSARLVLTPVALDYLTRIARPPQQRTRIGASEEERS
ncbi:50S ribosomal protein L4 [bacterium HR41]|nr:50S ribosomal protein L4 [bacterium HR41]